MSTALPLGEPGPAPLQRFIDALWIEDGLAKLTLGVYRRDLTLYAHWEANRTGRPIASSTVTDLLGYIAHHHAGSRVTTANRRLTVFKRFIRWALRERLVGEDAALRLGHARQALRVPQVLSGAQVEALLAAPDVASPWGCATARCWSCCTPAARA